ncbi:MAG: carbon starvation protein A [Crenarchaeota archaeon]|nr:carbon starvation protein A [Thermoproteota archaeon]
MIPTLALMIIGAVIIYIVFYFVHGKYLERRVFKADPSRRTPAHLFKDNVDYVPTNRFVLYGHHFASIAGAGPIIGPAIALGWGWLPALLWVWLGNVFIGVVHDYLSIAASVRYEGRSIAWVSSKLMGRQALYAFNTYIWFALVLVVAAFAFVISALFSMVPGAGAASLIMIALAVIVGYVMYRTRLGIGGGTVLSIVFLVLSIVAGYYIQMMGFKLGFYEWLIILTVYTIVAAVLPVWVLLQPRDYMNAYLLWASLAIGGAAAIVASFKGAQAVAPALTQFFTARVIGSPPQPSPFWPAVPLVIACGALSGFHSLVGSGTTSKQLDREIDALMVGYGGMLTEGFLATMVIASMSGFLGYALLARPVLLKMFSSAKSLVARAVGVPVSKLSTLSTFKTYYVEFVHKLLTDPAYMGQYYVLVMKHVKWIAIPLSYAYMTNYAFGFDVRAMTIFATLWITAFALTSLDTGARIGRYVWQELMTPLKDRARTLYKVLSNRIIASLILVGLGVLLAWGKAFLVIWPAFAGMNQLLASLALMTISLWVIKVQKAPKLGKALTLAPAIFLWITVTLALIWFLIIVVPATPNIITAIIVGTATCIGLGLNTYLFALWIKALRTREQAKV